VFTREITAAPASLVYTLSFLYTCYAKLEERDHLEESGVDGSTLIQCNLRLLLFWNVTWLRLEAWYRRFGEIIGSVISGFLREVDEICALLGYNT